MRAERGADPAADRAVTTGPATRAGAGADADAAVVDADGTKETRRPRAVVANRGARAASTRVTAGLAAGDRAAGDRAAGGLAAGGWVVGPRDPVGRLRDPRRINRWATGARAR